MEDEDNYIYVCELHFVNVVCCDEDTPTKGNAFDKTGTAVVGSQQLVEHYGRWWFAYVVHDLHCVIYGVPQYDVLGFMVYTFRVLGIMLLGF